MKKMEFKLTIRLVYRRCLRQDYLLHRLSKSFTNLVLFIISIYLCFFTAQLLLRKTELKPTLRKTTKTFYFQNGGDAKIIVGDFEI